MNRRDFLLASMGALGAAAGPSWLGALARRDDASAAGTRRLVVVMLDGGNDGLNTLVPYLDDRYHAARPALALAPERLVGRGELDGWHPSLPNLARRFDAGGVGVLRGVGYPGPNLSHFRSKDIWETASLELPLPQTGWIGRLVDARLPDSADPTAMLAVGSVRTPPAMRAARHQAYALPDAEQFRVRAPEGDMAMADARRRALAALNTPAEALGTAAPVAGAVTAAGVSIEVIERALERTPRAEYPDTALAHDLNIVARAIDADLPTRCFFVEQFGYDTHTSQAGTHDRLLQTLDGALDAFLLDLERLGRLEQTQVLLISEFGRRVAENGVGATAGTDHGAPGPVFLLGGGIAPGLHGSRPDLGTLDENGNMIFETDFRSVYADVIEGWFGVPHAAVLGERFPRAGVVVG